MKLKHSFIFTLVFLGSLSRFSFADYDQSAGAISVRDWADKSAFHLIHDLEENRAPKGSVKRLINTDLFSNDQLKLHLIVEYELPQVLCYVMQVQNLENQAMIVPINSIWFPRLLAVSTEKRSLAARGTDGSMAKVYMVVGKEIN